MLTIHQINQEISRLTALLQERQSADGSWRFCFEGGILTDAYMIVLLKTLNIDDKLLISHLAERIALKQERDGTWKLFPDENEGNLSTTIEGYYALLFAGYRRKEDREMRLARQFIVENGGLEKAHILTKLMLTLTGQYPWKAHPQFPIEFILLPPDLFVSFYDLASFTRVHIAPILIVSKLRFSLQTKETPDLSELFIQNRLPIESHRNMWKNISTFLQRPYPHVHLGGEHEYKVGTNSHPVEADTHLVGDDLALIGADADNRVLEPLTKLIDYFIDKIESLPEKIKSYALQYAEQYILRRIEPDGLLYSYFSCTFLMIFALLALGYPKEHTIIQKAIAGLKKLVCNTNAEWHIENSTSTVWDTALISYALQEAGMSYDQPMIQQANHYLLSRQQTRYGDWRINNPEAKPGGWGFSDSNTLHPDVDDTTAALRALHGQALHEPDIRKHWKRGLQWVLSMQNDDGGWPAFERAVDQDISEWVPYDGMELEFIDPSTPDLTGRTLEFLGNYVTNEGVLPYLSEGMDWLLTHQKEDGSWHGRWGVSMIYGTWAALTGLKASGVSSEHPSLQKGVRCLESIQHPDGGWGESCKSDIQGGYVSLGASTPSQTAWAVDALIAVYEQPTEAIEKGIRFLIDTGRRDNWATRYPTGTGLTGGFYIHYHSYRYIWPLLALGHYKKKFF